MTILCSSELVAYLGVSPRELHPNQISELQGFMSGEMLCCDNVDLDTGRGPFFTHCGWSFECIPVMLLSSSRYVKLSCSHFPALREGNPPFVPYVAPAATEAREVMGEEDIVVDQVVSRHPACSSESEEESGEEESSEEESGDEEVAESYCRAPMEVDREISIFESKRAPFETDVAAGAVNPQVADCFFI